MHVDDLAASECQYSYDIQDHRYTPCYCTPCYRYLTASL